MREERKRERERERERENSERKRGGDESFPRGYRTPEGRQEVDVLVCLVAGVDGCG